MEKINQLIGFIGLILVMTTCMTGTVVNQGKINRFSKDLSKKLEDSGCVTTTVRNQACHGDRCHNSTTYIHGCDTYDDQWDNFTVTFDVHNSTGWRNTTCHLYATYNLINDDDCGFANLTFKSCTNGDCRSGITDIYACYSASYAMNPLSSVSVLDDDGGVGDFFDIPCINLLFGTFQRRHSIRSKKENRA